MDGTNMSLYENGVQIGETTDTGISLSDLGDTTQNYVGYSQYGDEPTTGQFAEIKIYDRALSSEEIQAMYAVDDAGIVSADKDELSLGDTSAVIADIELPQTGVNGSAITWTSENAAIVIEDGVAKVTRPAAGSENVTGTLTATIAKGEVQEQKTFDVTVMANYTELQAVEHDADAAAKTLGDLSSVIADFELPTKGDWGSEITWTSQNSAIVITDNIAKVTRPAIGEDNAAGTITAEVSYGTEKKTVALDVTVLAYREAVTITEAEKIEVTTTVGKAPKLPYYVKVIYSDNSTNKLKAVWPSSIDESLYAAAGTFDVKGSIAGEIFDITATVTVVDKAEAAKYAVSESFDLSDISLDAIGENGSLLTQNRDRDIVYLKLLDNKRMLYNFYKTFGQTDKIAGVEPLGGWDDPSGLLRGHSTGHYMSALALAYASTGDAELKTKLDEMISELHSLQQMSKGNAKDFVTNGVLTSTWSTDPNVWGEGFVSAYSPDQFALLEQYVPYGSPDSGIWAPYYTLHKLLAGFLDAYTYTGNEEALEVAKGVGKWAYNRLSACSQKQLTDMWDMYIAGEFGGFNECMAQLYIYTGDEDFLKGAKLFDNTTFFDNLANNIDDIAGRHANQHIPQIIGAMKMYEASVKAGSPETYYYDIAENFWEMAVSRYAYSTGGVGTGEKFTEPYQQANNIAGTTNCETCAAYNMMKLTKMLNNYDPDNAEYMDYYERTLYNQILASQTPNVTANMHNGTTYMLPIGPGSVRDYGDDYNSFTCCHGTGMENHVKYQEAAYVKTADTLYVALYLPSTVTWEEKGVAVKQETTFPSETSTFTVSALEGSTAQNFDMKLRVPYWATKGMTVKVNGEDVKVDAQISSYATLENIKAGDVIEVTMPWSLHLDATPDTLGSSTVASIMYGPFVMAAADENKAWTTLILSETIEDSIQISTNEANGFPVLKAKGYNFAPMFAPEYATDAYSAYFKVLLVADDGSNWYQVKVTNTTPVNGEITTTAQADMVKEGNNLVITCKPNEGYIVKKLVVNGEQVQVDSDNTYTVKDVAGDVDISVSFRPPVLDQNNLEYSASVSSDWWEPYYGQIYDIMKDWEPDTSYSHGKGYVNWWSPAGTVRYVQYDWDDPVTADTFNVYWRVNSDQTWMKVPAAIQIQYLDGDGNWADVNMLSKYEDINKVNQYNTISFDPVTTTAVRMYMTIPSDDEVGASGIYRWKVSNSKADTPTPTPVPDVKVAQVTGLKATASTTSVKLSWKKVSGASGYVIQRAKNSSKSYSVVKTIKGNTASYNDKKLASATGYKYKVYAYKTVDGKDYNGKASSVVKTVTKPTKVGSVSVKRTSKVSRKSTATLKFKKVTHASVYKIYKYNKSKKKYQIAYKVQKNYLYKYNTRTGKYTKLRKVTASGGKLTCKLTSLNLKGEKNMKFKVKAGVSRSGYKTTYGAYSKVVTLK